MITSVITLDFYLQCDALDLRVPDTFRMAEVKKVHSYLNLLPAGRKGALTNKNHARELLNYTCARLTRELTQPIPHPSKENVKIDGNSGVITSSTRHYTVIYDHCTRGYNL